MSQLPNLTFPNNVYVQGSIGAKVIKPTIGTVDDNAVDGSANIAATKLQHRYQATHSQGIAANASAEEVVLHVARAAGTVVSFAAGLHTPPDTAPGGSGRTATLNLKKNGTTVLSSTIQLDNASVAITLESESISVGPYVAGDVFTIAITTGGSSGTHPIGVYAVAQFDENAV